MAEHREGAPTRRPVPVPPILVTALVAVGAAHAQVAHPFAPPVAIGAFGFDSTAGFADLDRDGSTELLVPGLFFGTMICSLDENGSPLAVNRPGPGLSLVPRSPSYPFPIAIVAGCIDGDGLEDAIIVSNVGSVHFYKNRGATVQGGHRFDPDVVIDTFGGLFPVNPPFVAYVFPTARLVDIDGDGDLDLLLAGGPLDRWSGASMPGFVCIYEGDGNGDFTPHRVNLAGNAIDAELADLNSDGSIDHLVVLMETGAVGAFSNDLLHFTLNGTTPIPVGWPQPVAPGRMTALEIADVVGDGNADYLLATTSIGGTSPAAAIYYFAGDGAGNLNTAVWSTFLLPTPGAQGDHICSFLVGDWNRDSHLDVAALRGYTRPPASSLGTASYSDSELLIAMGPGVAMATFETISLSGYHCISQLATPQGSLLPFDADPDYLRHTDLGHDGDQDLVVCGLRSPNAATPMFAVTLRNETPQQAGDARFEKVGDATGGISTRRARLGFEGGRPAPGNPQFACTILNVQADSLVGLMWGPIAAPGMIPLPMFGFDVHVLPAEFGYPAIADGTGFADGFYSYPLPIPNLAGVIGDAGYFQYCYYDPLSGTFGGTQATGVWIGN